MIDLEDAKYQRVVCNRGGASIWTGEVIEPLVVAWIEDITDLPVPTVIAHGSLSTEENTTRWALYEYCEGTMPSMETPAERERLAALGGTLLGQLHAARSFEQRGGLGRSDETLEIRPTEGVSILESRLGRHFVTVNDAPTHEPPSVLAHGDFRPANLLVRNGRISAVLDWGNAHITHPGFSLARAEVRFVDLLADDSSERGVLRDRFRTSYAAHHRLPASVITELPRFKALWVAQAARNLLGVARTPHGRWQLRRQLRDLRSRGGKRYQTRVRPKG